MNINPEALGRLKRLASSARKKIDTQTNSGSHKNGVANKEEGLEPNPKQNKEEETNSGRGSSAGTNGRTLLSRKNETENDMATQKSKETIKDSEIKLDMDTFRQMLKEVIVKRTLEVEERIMGDVEALRKQILSLEAEKKTLQMDAERLQQTLNEISSKHEMKKAEMISCGTQIDIDLVQGNQPSPQIVKLITETSIHEKLISTNMSQRADNTHQAATVDVAHADRHHFHEHRGKLENVKTSESRRISDSNVHYNNAKQVTAKPAAIAIVGDSRTSSKQTVLGPPTHSPPQRQQLNSDTSQVHVRDSESAHRHSPEIPIEEPHPLQRPRSYPPARSEVPPNPQMHTQGQALLPIQRQTGHEVLKSSPAITSPVQGHFSPRPPRPQWHPSQLENSTNRLQMPRSSQTDDVSSHSYSTLKRGPPNVSLFDRSNKRKRGDKRWNDDGFHVVSSNNNYVMHNFKVKPIPKVIPKVITKVAVPINQRRLQPKPTVSISEHPQGNQAVYTTSPSSQLRRPYLNQGSSNLEPTVHPSRLQPNQRPGQFISQQSSRVQPVVHPAPHPIHETGKAPVHPPRLSQGQLAENVVYPSSRPRQASTEYGPRVTPAHSQPSQRVEPAHTYGQPTDTSGTVYVVREYQVSQQGVPIQTAHAPPPLRPAPFQQATQALPGVPRSQPHPPVQSPGISSTASPSGRHPGNPNVGFDQRGTVSQSEALVVANDSPRVQLGTPPKPSASIVVVQDGIVLSWNMRLDETMAQIDNYELFACQDGAESTNPPIMWKKIGIVKALPLPMACTLSQFSSGNKYHFAVRAVDDQERAGPFSDPCTISLT